MFLLALGLESINNYIHEGKLQYPAENYEILEQYFGGLPVVELAGSTMNSPPHEQMQQHHEHTTLMALRNDALCHPAPTRVLVALVGRNVPPLLGRRQRDATRRMPLTEDEEKRLVRAIARDHRNPHLVANLGYYNVTVVDIVGPQGDLGVVAEEGVYDAVVTVLAHGCPNLTVLTLACHSNMPEFAVTDTGLAVVGTCCPNLTTFRLEFFRGNECVTDAGVKALANCHNLTSIDLSECNISDVAIKALVIGCPGLTAVTLDLIECDGITNDAIAALANGCLNLVTITLKYAGIDIDTAVKDLANCSNLTTIRFE